MNEFKNYNHYILSVHLFNQKKVSQVKMMISIQDYQQLDIMANEPIFPSENTKNPNRLYLTWKNHLGIECKMIGPQTKCFCNHRFKQHQYLNPIGGKTHCISKTCKCKTFQYIPTHGAYDFKCLCKHSFKQHDRNNKLCQRQKCTACKGFASTWTCSCGQKYSNHQTISQTYQERKKQNKPLNDLNRMANQLESNIKEGSLYKPIKIDKQSKMKKQSQTLGHRQKLLSNMTFAKEKDELDEIEEIYFRK